MQPRHAPLQELACTPTGIGMYPYWNWRATLLELACIPTGVCLQLYGPGMQPYWDVQATCTGKPSLLGFADNSRLGLM